MRLLFDRIRWFARRHRKWFWAVAGLLIALTLASRISVAYFLGNDEPGDGIVYARLARNLLEQGVFSAEEEAPFTPTLVRTPGYPLFVAGVYSVFGHANNTAVRIVQAILDTVMCVIIAAIAWVWTEDERRKRKAAFWTFVLAALCPFIVVYSGLIMTETLTTFLMASMTLMASLALKSERWTRTIVFWAATGIISGVAVMVRPDTGLFAAGIGLTLIVSELFLSSGDRTKILKKLASTSWKGAVFSIAFCLVLVPWTIRNYRVFGMFQPVSPMHGEAPGEFVPNGYFRWLRTWVDDFRFIEPMQWNLGEKQIDLASVPRKTFDSPEERERVAALLYQYDHPLGSENKDVSSDNSADADSDEDSGDEDGDQSSNSGDENSGDDQSDAASDDNADDENSNDVVAMTPEIDAGFAQIAQERIDRAPFRYYLFLPAKRAAGLWFDSHSLYYPFGGQLSKIDDLDHDVSQQYWLPFFVALMWAYTLLAVGGVIVFWRERSDKSMLRWLLLLALMTLPRIIFFSTVENPEPRYFVELFAFVTVLGGVFIAHRKRRRKQRLELPAGRLVSLDAFRGLTIAAMVVVNEPGLWTAVYPPLRHAEWNGATPTDWIFPFFLFAVGVSIVFALDRHKPVTADGVFSKVMKRTAVLFALGLVLEAFPFYNIWTGEWFDPATMRIMGVLQRIAICYLASSLIFLKTSWRFQAAIVSSILLSYWALMTVVPVPGCDTATFSDVTCNLAGYVDRLILGTNHIWSQSAVLDPEGLLSTLPAIATTLIGVMAGEFLKDQEKARQKTRTFFAAGAALFVVGWLWSFWFPLNKTLWTSSYVLYTGGLAILFLTAFRWLIDLKGYKKWAAPFVVFGTNAIALYVGATLLGKTLDTVELAAPHDATVTLQEKLYNALFSPLSSPAMSSLSYSIAFLLVWLFLMWLLYRRRIFIKI
jgi:predicted acyltransferase